MGKNKASREVGNLFFFFLIQFFIKGEKVKKKIENREKNSSSRPFLAHPAGGQETTFYLRVACCGPPKNAILFTNEGQCTSLLSNVTKFYAILMNTLPIALIRPMAQISFVISV